MKDKVLVFGGTTEGRLLCRELEKAGVFYRVSVATEYGREPLDDIPKEKLYVGRKDSEAIYNLIKDEGFLSVFDATHPFAKEASGEIKKACSRADVEYIRIKRNTSAMKSDSAVYVDSLNEAAKLLAAEKGNILLLTGSRDLDRIIEAAPDILPRLFVRVLPDEGIIRKLKALGLKGRQIIAMQGPFSLRMNAALIKEVDAKCILTKQSGQAGGFFEKLKAAEECKIRAIVLKDSKDEEDASSCNIDFALEKIRALSSSKEITLAGAGPGDERYFTFELKEAIKRADIIFGAKGVADRINTPAIPVILEYNPESIYKYLSDNPVFSKPLVLFSGDISLYSGAKNVSDFFEKKEYRIKRIPGISSVFLFASRLGISLEDTGLISSHGRNANVRGYARAYNKLIILPSDAGEAVEICRKLYNPSVRLVIGSSLGTDEERLIDYKGGADDIKECSGRCIIYYCNNRREIRPVVFAPKDEDFIRDTVPMTKEEIRAVVMRKLSLTPGSVFYDIGAGSGSVSVEAALLHPDIRVFSIEKSVKALSLLEKNIEKFHADNISITGSAAPEALEGLPKPSHVFIGGSSGRISEILQSVTDKNENVRIVINVLTPETFSKVMDAITGLEGFEADIICLWVSRYVKKGSCHMPQTFNPVYIITLERRDI